MILLLDGTSDSRDLACELMASGYSIIATAITSDGVKRILIMRLPYSESYFQKKIHKTE